MTRRMPAGFVCILISVFLLSNAWAGRRLYVLPSEDIELDEMPAIQALSSSVQFESPLVQNAPVDARYNLHRWKLVELADDADVEAVRSFLESRPEIAVAEFAPDRSIFAGGELDERINDPFASLQWHLDIIDAYAAWDLVPDASQAVVAIADLGIAMDHPDLEDALWTNTAEANGQPNVDDDGNGYIDDIHGWDAVDWDGDPTPSSGAYHGTHVAGITGATADNNRGVAGVAPGVRLMNLRIGANNSFGAEPSYDAVIYAVLNGADVINMSYGGSDNSLFEKTLFDWAWDNGVVPIAAAGNNGSQVKQYPAAYESVIAIASTDPDDRLSNFSQYGTWVDIAAPGSDIMSTVIDGYSYDSGTSMACPVAAGVAALIVASDPSLSPAGVRARLMQGCEPLYNVGNPGVLNGRVNAYRAVLGNRPALELIDISFTGSGAYGLVEPGDHANVSLTLDLLGANAGAVQVGLTTLSSSMPASGTATISNQSMGQFTVDQLVLDIDEDLERGFYPVGLTLYADGYRDTMTVTVPVSPPWLVHEAGDMRATVTDFGAIGFTDLTGQMLADGVRVEGVPGSPLIHGSLLVNFGNRVSDAAYNFEFETVLNGEIHQIYSSEGYQVYQATYAHEMSGPTESNRVAQRTTSDPDGGNWVMFEYEVTRTSTGSDPYRIGMYCDWDFRPYHDNTVGYDQSLGLQYIQGSSGAGGIVILDDTDLSAVVAIDNYDYIYDGFADTSKVSLMSSGTGHASSSTENDWSQLVVYDVGTLDTWESAVVRFAIVAGTTVDEIKTAAQQVRAVAGVIAAPRSTSGQNGLATDFSISQVYPSPFNSSTRIEVALPGTGQTTVEIFNTLGQKVSELYSGNLQAGHHSFTWNGMGSDGRSLASGLYLVRARFTGNEAMRKVILLR